MISLRDFLLTEGQPDPRRLAHLHARVLRRLRLRKRRRILFLLAGSAAAAAAVLFLSAGWLVRSSLVDSPAAHKVYVPLDRLISGADLIVVGQVSNAGPGYADVQVSRILKGACDSSIRVRLRVKRTELAADFGHALLKETRYLLLIHDLRVLDHPQSVLPVCADACACVEFVRGVLDFRAGTPLPQAFGPFFDTVASRGCQEELISPAVDMARFFGGFPRRDVRSILPRIRSSLPPGRFAGVTPWYERTVKDLCCVPGLIRSHRVRSQDGTSQDGPIVYLLTLKSIVGKDLDISGFETWWKDAKRRATRNPRPGDRARVEELIAQMGAQDPEVRQAAEAQILELGPVALEAVRDAVRSPDPEIRDRAVRLGEELELISDLAADLRARESLWLRVDGTWASETPKLNLPLFVPLSPCLGPSYRFVVMGERMESCAFEFYGAGSQPFDARQGVFSARANFACFFPWDPRTERFVVRRGGQTVAEWVRSAHPPRIENLSFRQVEPGRCIVTWRVSDADGTPIRCVAQLLVDGECSGLFFLDASETEKRVLAGQGYIVFARRATSDPLGQWSLELDAEKIMIDLHLRSDTDPLRVYFRHGWPEAKTLQVRVLASDGLRTVSEISETFSLK